MRATRRGTMGDRDRMLAVDIGNTNARLAVVDMARLRCVARVLLPTSALGRRFSRAWTALRRQTGTAWRGPAGVSCVAPPRVLRHCLRRLARAGVGPVVRVRGDLPLPLAIDYVRPQVLGPDRIAGAVYCAKRFPGRNCVVVSAGTAVTVDYVSRGRRFCGGAIVPGPSLQLLALARDTAALPRATAGGGRASLPARDTADCMTAGVRYGLAGAVERIVAEYRRRAGGVDLVVSSGGAWPLLAPLVRRAFRHEPDAVLVGTALCARHALGRGAARPGRGARGPGRAPSSHSRAPRRAAGHRA